MTHTPIRFLAFDPTTKGFGYVIFELPSRLVAWGLAHISGDKISGAIARFTKLLDHTQPQAIVLEDTGAPGSLRRPRVRKLIERLAAVARERGLAVYMVARKAVLDCFSSGESRATKHSIAVDLAQRFPGLAGRLPDRRKSYESQDERMAIFDALALAVTHAAAQ